MDEDEIKGDEMAEESKDWITRHWGQLTSLVIVVIAVVTMKNNSDANAKDIENIKKDIEPVSALVVSVENASNKNSLTYLNLEQFKKDYYNDSKELSKVMGGLTTAITKFNETLKHLDDRYLLRREVDQRLVKTAYRDEKQ